MKKIFILSLFSIFFITLSGFAKVDYVYVGSDDNEVYLITSANEIIWTYSEFETDVVSITTDAYKNIYAISLDEIHKIDPNGNEVWSLSTSTTPNYFIHVDDNGFIYFSAGLGLMKLDSDGNTIYNIFSQAVFGVDVDLNGNAYIATDTEGIRKVSPTGDIIWSNKTDAGENFQDLYLDSNNNIFTVSISNNEIVKFDDDGNFIDSVSGLTDTATLIVDNNNNVYVGNRSGTIKLVKYDNDLNEIWNREVEEVIFSFYVDENNFIYTGGVNDIIKYSPTGALIWEINSNFTRISGIAVYRDYRYDSTTTGLIYLLPTLYTITIISGGFVFAIVRKNENRMQSMIETAIFIVLGLSLLPIIIAIGQW